MILREINSDYSKIFLIYIAFYRDDPVCFQNAETEEMEKVHILGFGNESHVL